MKLKSIALLAIVLVFCVGLLGCNGKSISGDEAKAHILSFFEAVEAGDYEKAETHLHPERPISLEKFFGTIKESENLDFQSDITIEKYTGFSSSYYDSTVKGSAYTLDMKTTVGDKDVKISIEIVRNEKGFGIYNLDINP